ncbi:hypothetical protein ACJMK2_017864 [Sinanodonta woodiana]|uniref:Lysosome-associated membrane glycoprotein 5 n=1 Tax=Sinanodonta woodiana TaxID=1069815 RepID=A0ABD3UDP1_SINWO
MGLILQSLVTCLFVTYVHGLVFRFPSNKACIIAQMDARFNLSNSKASSILKDPQLDEVNSKCANGSTATLALKWTDTNDTMTFTFIKGVEKVTMHSVYGFIPVAHFKDSKNNTLIEMDGPQNELSMSNMSYKCDSPQSLKFAKDIYQLVMSVAKVQVQAFEVENGKFSDYEECSEDSSTTAPETTTHQSQTTTGQQTTIIPLGDYTYVYPSSDRPCIILNSPIHLSITYINNKKTTVTRNVDVLNRLQVNITGQCAVNDTAFIMLTWKFKRSSKFSLKMEFIADTEAKLNEMEVKGVMTQEDFQDLPNKSMNVASIGSVDSFESSNLTYYYCNSTQEVKLDNVTTVVIDKIQVQAFGVNKTFTGDGKECSQDFSTENPMTSTMHTNTTTSHNTTSTESTTIPVSNSTTASTTPISTTAAPLHPKNNYSVSDGGITCVYFEAGMDFTFSYNTTNGTKTAVISVPQKFTTNGTCSMQNATMNETLNVLSIYFYTSWNLTFVFSPDNSSSQLGDMQFKTYSVKSIELHYKMEPNLFPGSNDTQTHYATANFTGALFQSKANGSYKCNVDTEVTFTGNVKLNTYNLQYKAFNHDNSTNFGGELSECSGDNSNDNKTNSVVPIAVGAALAGLVVIVLIAYLIGRRRNRKGYESV